jgi:hypothetical protein
MKRMVILMEIEVSDRNPIWIPSAIKSYLVQLISACRIGRVVSAEVEYANFTQREIEQ